MNKGNAGKGRRKGVPNKITQSAREAFEYAFRAIGGGPALATWAKDNRTEFYKLYGKLIPQAVEGSGEFTLVVRYAERNEPGD